MKQKFAVLVLVALAAAALCTTPAFTQSTGTVKGVCKDLEGKPMTGAVVQLTSQETGRKYEIKTNNKGEYFSLGIAPGKYNVSPFEGRQRIIPLRECSRGFGRNHG